MELKLHELKEWVEIDLERAKNNFLEIKGLVGSTRVMAVVKADAYGHGAVKMGALYESLGVDYLGVSSLDEAIELRRAGIACPILILGYTPQKSVSELLKHDIAQTVFSLDWAQEADEILKKQGKKLKIHLKVDTGMSRLGFAARDVKKAAGDILKVLELGSFDAEGIFSHFASSDDEKEDDFTKGQLNSFLAVVDALSKEGKSFKIRHMANSGGTLYHEESRLDMVRVGIILYGLSPKGNVPLEEKFGNFKPVMSFKSIVADVREVKAGESISYGRAFFAKKDMKIATVPVGYADGYMRNLSSKAHMLVKGKRVLQTGAICMDQCMIDVSGVADVRTGDEVTIFGNSGDHVLPIEELANILQTINYELICAISRRVPRVYIGPDGEKSAISYMF